MGRTRIDVTIEEGVHVIKFKDKKILDEATIQAIATELYSVVEEDGAKKVVISFKGNECYAPAALGILISMDIRVKAAKGKLRMCELPDNVIQLFGMIKLNELVDCYDTLAEALKDF